MSYVEPFGPEYVRPAGAPCPDCECCTAALCARGRASVLRCVNHVDAEELKESVRECPCSAESTRGTLAWRAAMVRAVTFATEKPLRPEVERLLTDVYEAELPNGEREALMPILAVRRYVTWAPGSVAQITDFGCAYVWARRGVRTESVVSVLSVDVEARTAQVIIPAFSADQPVTVMMDQLVNSRTEVTVETVLTVPLYAEVNPDAVTAEFVVLTKVRNPVVAARPGRGL